MPVYKVAYTEEVWRECEIVADSEDDAFDKFWSGEFDPASDRITGSEIADSFEIVEVK